MSAQIHPPRLARLWSILTGAAMTECADEGQRAAASAQRQPPVGAGVSTPLPIHTGATGGEACEVDTTGYLLGEPPAWPRETHDEAGRPDTGRFSRPRAADRRTKFVKALDDALVGAVIVIIIFFVVRTAWSLGVAAQAATVATSGWA